MEEWKETLSEQVVGGNLFQKNFDVFNFKNF